MILTFWIRPWCYGIDGEFIGPYTYFLLSNHYWCTLRNKWFRQISISATSHHHYLPAYCLLREVGSPATTKKLKSQIWKLILVVVSTNYNASATGGSDIIFQPNHSIVCNQFVVQIQSSHNQCIEKHILSLENAKYAI